MKQTSTTKTSAISEDEAPALSQANFDHAGFRIGQQKVSRSAWQTAVRGRIAKQRISIMLDAPIIARYKAIAGERGYQTLINDTLRRAVEGDRFVQDMRNAIWLHAESRGQFVVVQTSRVNALGTGVDVG